MPKTSETDIDSIEKLSIDIFAQNAYSDYANYVIKDRALPRIGDGLKPVQRRIVYAMAELGLNSISKHKKSARTVGDVLGKFHPHGDTACYEAMVLMAQPFSYRYPIIDGQGNWGAPEDPKSFAAMRYTEARLSEYANILLSETNMGTINWESNFDGSINEPVELPARLPNILINGTRGIAVGMSTDIPPHNINEVVKACIRLIDKPKSDNENICKYIHGPDFPTGAEIITPKKEIIAIYNKGKGTIRVRATYKIEKKTIIITALPYQVSPAKIMQQITDQIKNKKLPFPIDIKDESNHEIPIRLVIYLPKTTKNINFLISHLLATTELEKPFRINMNVIGINGKPSVKNLTVLLKEWIFFRVHTIKRRLKSRLEKVKSNLEVFEGLLIAHLNIDKIINVIKVQKNPKNLMKKNFKLTNNQIESILGLKLGKLSNLEEIKIKYAQSKLKQEKYRLKKALASEANIRKLLKQELRSDSKKYGDERRTAIIIRQKTQAFSEVDLIHPEPVTVILSKNGWVRTAKGHNISTLR